MKTKCEITKVKLALLAIILAGLAPSLHATIVTASQTDNIVIPDNNLNGVAETINLSAPFTSISDVEVSLDISGGYDGDYYAYLRNSTGFAVLLNRVGSTINNPYGSPDSGFNVTFSDSAANGDIHLENAGGGMVSGTRQPDGRNVSPLTALDTDPRTAFLSSFNGLNPNGAWTLFIADCSPGGQGTLDSWSLDVTGNGLPIPEPTTLISGVLLLLPFGATTLRVLRKRHTA
jgi:subtilisin-like proprotein convertase family protein